MEALAPRALRGVVMFDVALALIPPALPVSLRKMR
jgi:hypothetical protein